MDGMVTDYTEALCINLNRLIIIICGHNAVPIKRKEKG